MHGWFCLECTVRRLGFEKFCVVIKLDKDYKQYAPENCSIKKEKKKEKKKD